MPFDATKLRDLQLPTRGKLNPRITILPPTPPERGVGPRRVRIEIVDRRPITQARGYRFGTLTLWLVVVIFALAMLAG